jgi:hypothetical protein
MSPVNQALSITACLRLGCIAAGCFVTYLGFRLFKLGIYDKAGDLEGRWDGFSLTLRQVGPGVFFALFGLGLAALGFSRPFKWTLYLPSPLPTKALCPLRPLLPRYTKHPRRSQ